MRMIALAGEIRLKARAKRVMRTSIEAAMSQRPAGNAGSRSAINGHPLIARKSRPAKDTRRSEEHTSELQSLMRISYAVFCLKKKTTQIHTTHTTDKHTHKTRHNNTQHYVHR